MPSQLVGSGDCQARAGQCQRARTSQCQTAIRCQRWWPRLVVWTIRSDWMGVCAFGSPFL